MPLPELPVTNLLFGLLGSKKLKIQLTLLAVFATFLNAQKFLISAPGLVLSQQAWQLSLRNRPDVPGQRQVAGPGADVKGAVPTLALLLAGAVLTAGCMGGGSVDAMERQRDAGPGPGYEDDGGGDGDGGGGAAYDQLDPLLG